MTPNANFFIRDHSRTPVIEQKDWKLKIEGNAVDKPFELTYADLTALPAVTVTRLLECTGNGRSFFETIGGQKAQGTQWRLGAVGVAEWKGARLADVLAKAGLKPTATDVLAEGLDDLKVRRPIPIDKAKEADVILAYSMNGEPLPPDHGGPVRLLVPNWIGISSIKWVGRLEVSDAPIYTAWNTDSYVLVGPTYQSAPPSKGPIITTYPVKSALELPWPAELKAGNQTIKGRSWSGSGSITRVEYSIDGGKSYQAAKLQDTQSVGSWARWSFDWTAPAGEQTIRVRATDEKGNTQPDTVPFNEQGYLYNGIVPHPVKVT